MSSPQIPEPGEKGILATCGEWLHALHRVVGVVGLLLLGVVGSFWLTVVGGLVGKMLWLLGEIF